MSGRKFKVLDNNKKNFTKEEIAQREAMEENAGADISSLQKTAPAHLSRIGKVEYYRIWNDLQKLPIRDLDRAVLELYCTWYAIYREAENDVNEHGIFTYGYYTEIEEDEYGLEKKVRKKVIDTTKKNPSLTVLNDAASNIMRCASNLGLTVDSRMRIYTPPKEEKEKTLKDMFG